MAKEHTSVRLDLEVKEYLKIEGERQSRSISYLINNIVKSVMPTKKRLTTKSK